MGHKYLLGIFAMLGSNWVLGQDVYGHRYCEIVASQDYREFKIFHKENCPLSWWQHLSEKRLETENHLSFIHLNGPRIWLADEIKSSHFLGHEAHQFSGMNLNLVAKFKPELNMLLQKHGPYTDYHIHRDQTYAFHKGRDIVELISPQGKIYILHSLSLKHQAQSPQHIDIIINRIHPPRGWYLKHGILSIQHQLQAQEHKVHVIQDELENTYQLSQSDWLS